jgi:hypothetical protein
MFLRARDVKVMTFSPEGKVEVLALNKEKSPAFLKQKGRQG